ncbi:hypothetical protein ACFXTO_003688 [Malus domestica]
MTFFHNSIPHSLHLPPQNPNPLPRVPLFIPATLKSQETESTITMRDRSNNPRPLQKGRFLSIEAIQTVQALKRAQKDQSI